MYTTTQEIQVESVLTIPYPVRVGLFCRNRLSIAR